ncbi:MAG: DUF115 domain-containing protein [Zoogloea sp.]|nr:DUF115 domain-containing protein [Zoogloea sp.]
MSEQQEWTPLQEAYIGKLMATYQANLYFFRERFPAVFLRLMAANLPAPFDVGPDADVTMYLGRFKGSQREFAQLGQMLYRIFDDPETRPSIKVSVGYFDDPNEIICHGENPDFYRHVEPAFRSELIRLFKENAAAAGGAATKADFGERKLPMAIVFGSGYGWHLQRLVDDYEIRNLVLVDTDIARLNMSLYFVDYPALYERFTRAGRMFLVIFHDEIKVLARELVGRIQAYCPPYFLQGAGLFFEDYDSDNMKELWSALQSDFWMLYRGWGFLDDEILGFKHAVENLTDDWPVFSHKPDIPQDAVAFIVGAGPSLDTLLPVLREYGDRAVVISCGTAISALATAGVKPDFHLEIERTQVTYRILCTPHIKEWLKDIPLMASIIMAPDVYTLTPRPLMFLKELDLGSSLADFGNELPKIRTNPTCTNGGVDLALKMGFKEIYLVGVDLGFRDTSHHHSKASIYYAAGEKSDAVDAVVEETHQAHAEGIPVPGNFCDEVFSTNQFIYSRDAMQTSISEHPDAKVFNLNDGALIAGASPLSPEEMDISASAEIKRTTVEQIFSAFTPSGSDCLKNLDLLIEQLDAVAEDLRRIFSRPVMDRLTATDALAEMHEYFFANEQRSAQIFPLVRGSFLHLGRFTFDGIAFIHDDSKAADFARAVFDMYQRFLAAARDNLLSMKDVAAERRARRALH